MAARFLVLLSTLANALPQQMYGQDQKGQPTIPLPVGTVQLFPAMMRLMPATKPASVEQMKPTIPMEGAKKLKIRYGPYKLNAAGSKDKYGTSMSMDPAGTAFEYRVDGVPGDISVLMAYSKTVMEDGSPADITKGIYTHHITLNDPANLRSLMHTCGPLSFPDPVSVSVTGGFSGGAEEAGAATFTTFDGKFKSGFWVPKESLILLSAEIVNYNRESKIVYIENEIEYVEGRPPGFLDATLQMLHLQQCERGGSAWLKPSTTQKQYSLQGQNITASANGYLVFSKAHMHDGGQRLVFRINGNEVCTSVASYGGEGKSTVSADGQKWDTISNMTHCPAPIRVRKGDQFSLEAFFDLAAHPPRALADGGMGEEMATLLAYFAKESG